MRILYGVCGEGMGHAMRAAVVGRHLEEQGHALTFASSGPSLRYLEQRWPGRVIPTVGLEMCMQGGRVEPLPTLLSNIAKQLLGAPFVSLPAFFSAAGGSPEAVISDFDHWSPQIAHLLGLPLFAVDNIHFLSRFAHPADLNDESAAFARPVADWMVPGARHYFVTSFAPAHPLSPSDTSLHRPILRDEILRARGSREREHVVSYFNASADHGALTHAMALSGARFRAYGAPGLTAEVTLGGNVTLCPFSDEAFAADLATSRAVIGGAGFTLMSEAIYLGKPMLACPFENQYEQILNAGYLERLGYGERARVLDASSLLGFLERAPRYVSRLKSYAHDQNRELFSALDRALVGSR